MLSLVGNSCLLVYFKRELTPKLRQHCMKIWTTLSSHFIKICCWNSSPLFSSLIAVCFGSDFLVNHHESDCMTNELLQGKCANWHYYTWSQPSFYQKLKITPWTKKTTVKKTTTMDQLVSSAFSSPKSPLGPELQRPKRSKASYFQMLQTPSCHTWSVYLNPTVNDDRNTCEHLWKNNT